MAKCRMSVFQLIELDWRLAMLVYLPSDLLYVQGLVQVDGPSQSLRNPHSEPLKLFSWQQRVCKICRDCCGRYDLPGMHQQDSKVGSFKYCHAGLQADTEGDAMI